MTLERAGSVLIALLFGLMLFFGSADVGTIHEAVLVRVTPTTAP
jgi:hypothetical protein